MKHTRTMISTTMLSLVLLAVPGQLFAQQTPPAAGDREPAEENTSGTPGNSDSAGAPAPGDPSAETQVTEADNKTGDADKSPFEYQASEQISEDLSVSFPVDI